MAVTPDTFRVKVRSAWASKINWTQAGGVIVALFALFGVDIPPEVQAKALAAWIGIQSTVTWVTPSSLPPTSLPLQ
jgi:hypothetical protein